MRHAGTGKRKKRREKLDERFDKLSKRRMSYFRKRKLQQEQKLD
jgi:hypothetical protein